MSRLSKKSEAEIKSTLIDALEDIMDGDATSIRDKIKAIELVGREYGLFIERKQINVDIQSIVHQLSDRQLEGLAGPQVATRLPIIDVLPGVDVGASGTITSTSTGQLGSDPGDPGPRPQDEHGVDQGDSGANRKED